MNRRALVPMLLTWLTLVLVVSVARAGQLQVGDALPAATLRDWQGRPTDLGDLRGKVVIVDFWASWCEVCRTALPELDAVALRHRGEPLAVVAISIDRHASLAQRFLDDYLPQPHVELLRDPGAEVMARFGAGGMPTLYVVDRDGIVRDVKAGYESQQLDSLEPLLRRLLAAPTAGAGKD